MTEKQVWNNVKPSSDALDAAILNRDKMKFENALLKIAIVDKFPYNNWYSCNLARELSKILKGKGIVFLYGPKNSTSKQIGYCIYRRVWSPFLYPIQIIKQAIRDKVKILHIQFEFVTFGKFYVSILVIPLIALSKLLNFKVVVTLHGPVFPKNMSEEIINNLLPSSSKILVYLTVFYIILFYKLVNFLSSKIIVHAKIFQRWLFTYGIKNCIVIPHGVIDAAPMINHVKLNSWSSCFHDKKIILYFGVLSPRKGLEYLIRSFQEIASNFPESVLIIAGYEPYYYQNYKKSLEELIKSLGLEHKVFFTGFIEDEDVHILFSMAEIIVLPYIYSVSASGPLSIAIQHRKPIVATKTAFFSEILLNRCDAILIPPRDARALTKAIAKLLEDSSTREILSKNLAIKAHRYSWQRIAENTLKEYFDLVVSASNNSRVSIDN